MDNPNITMEEYIRLEDEKARRRGKEKIGLQERIRRIRYGLPPRDQRHQYLRFDGLQYTDADIINFETMLGKIHGREVHRVQVFDFGGLADLMADGLRGRMLIEHRHAQGHAEEMETARLIVCCNAGRSHAPEKVTVTDLFYLRGMDVG
ncbi:hypothetical protein Tco_0650833 [Tanacetum coccineum]